MKKMQAALAALVMAAGMIFLACASPAGSDSGSGGTATPTPTPTVSLVGSDWYSYNGAVLPSANSPAFTAPIVSAENAIITPDAGTGIAAYANTAFGDNTWKIQNVLGTAGTGYPKSVTAIARIGKTAVDSNRGFEINIGESSSCVKLLIRGDSGKDYAVFEKVDGTTDSAQFTGVTGYHVYQVAVTWTSATNGTVALYVDGASTPVISHTGTLRALSSPVTTPYFSFGSNQSSVYYNANIDWIVWTNKAAVTPAQALNTLPGGLGVYTGYGAAYVDTTAPANVTAFSGTATKTVVNLTWTNPGDGDFAGTTLSCSPAAGSLSSPVELGSGVTTYEVTGLTAATNYTFTLQSRDTTGNSSAGTSAGPYTLSTLNSTDATLSALAVSGTSVTSFAAGTYSYNEVLPYGAASFTISGTRNDVGATLEYALGATPASGDWVSLTSGTASSAITFAGASEIVNVRVTAEDGTTQHTYVVNLTRAAPSAVATLSALSLSGITLNETFASGTFAYTASVAAAVASTSVTTTKTDSTAVVSGFTNPVTLTTGANTINVLVTAQNGTTTNTYTIVITKAAPVVVTPVWGTASGYQCGPTGSTLPVVDSNTLATNGLIQVTGGKMESGKAALSAVKSQSLTGDFILTAKVKINAGTLSAANSARVGVAIWENTNMTIVATTDAEYWLDCSLDGLGAVNYSRRVWCDGLATPALSNGRSNDTAVAARLTTDGVWVRLARIGNTVEYWTSADNVTWVRLSTENLTSRSSNLPTAVNAVLFIATGANSNQVTVEFTNISITQ